MKTIKKLLNLFKVESEKKSIVQFYEHGQGFFITSEGEEIYFRSEKEYQKLNREYHKLLKIVKEGY